MSIDTVAIELECRRGVDEDRMRVERQEQRQRNTEAVLNMAMRMYIDTLTAPWRALAEQIRSEMR